MGYQGLNQDQMSYLLYYQYDLQDPGFPKETIFPNPQCI